MSACNPGEEDCTLDLNSTSMTEQVDRQAPNLTPIGSLEALRDHVGKKVYFRWDDSQQTLGHGTLIWTGDHESRYYDEVSHAGGKDADQWRTDVIGLSQDDFRERLRQWGSTATMIQVDKEELPAWRVNQGDRPQDVLVISRDRNLLKGEDGEPVGDHFEIKSGPFGVFILSEADLVKYGVSVEQTE